MERRYEMKPNEAARRNFLVRSLTVSGAALLAGCDRLSHTEWFPSILQGAEKLTRTAQRLVTTRVSMAQEFSESDISPMFRSNGTADPKNLQYWGLAAKDFTGYV